MVEEYEGRKGVFNSGVAFAERIDSLQRAINMARFNPMAVNPETGTFNFEILISANDGLLNEAWAKLNDTEKTFGERVRKTIHLFTEINPIVTSSSDGFKINNKNYKKFMELIDFYEKINKVFLDSHSLNNPDFEDNDGL